MERTDKRLLAGGAAVLLAAFLLSVLIGNSAVSTSDLVHGTGAGAVILRQVRLPRAFAAILCGTALSVSGLLLQTALNNVLCSPGVLGINSGAGLFVLLAGLFFPYQTFVRQGFAFVGALLAAAFVYLISRKAGTARTTLILAGVAVSSLFSAGINTVITVRPEAVADKTAFSLGGLSGVSTSHLITATPVITAGILIAFLLSNGLDLLSLGDDTAGGLGLNVRRCRLFALFAAMVLSAAAVSICGLLGFVGLLVPNLLRMSGSRKTSVTVTACILWGSSFLLLCDTASRYLFFPYELPVGLLLSFLGTPFFVYVLIKRRRKLSV